MYLLDTDSLSELIRRSPSEAFIRRLKEHPADSFRSSSISVMELRAGSMRRADHQVFWTRIEGEILSRVRILPFGTEEAHIAGDLLAHLFQKGTPIGIEDVMIAATAIHYGCIVITGNIRHFSKVPNLRIENWLR